MSIYLGNIQFNQVEEHLGYKLNDSDKELWDKYHSHNADLSDKSSCFHVFHIPTCIHFKGEEAKQAILTIFTPDKITKAVGKFQVYQIK